MRAAVNKANELIEYNNSKFLRHQPKDARQAALYERWKTNICYPVELWVYSQVFLDIMPISVKSWRWDYHEHDHLLRESYTFGSEFLNRL